MCSKESIKELTDITIKLIDTIYRKEERSLVIHTLENDCGNNLPLCNGWTSKQLERIRFAVIKFSEGQLDRFHYAIKLANTDWRDLLVEVCFADDIDCHSEWANKMLEIYKI